jgi:hypothetical protein
VSRDDESPHNLEEMIERIDQATRDRETVPLSAMLDAVGRRAFGPLLLVAGLIALSPLSGIPGMPTSVAVLVTLIAVQLLLGKEIFWLPQWLLRRSVSRAKLAKALAWGRPPARFVDRLLRPRLKWLTSHMGAYLAAVLCILIAAAMPPLELLPFAASVAGAAVAAYGLALMTEDGLVALIALGVTLGAAGLLIFQILQW